MRPIEKAAISCGFTVRAFTVWLHPPFRGGWLESNQHTFACRASIGRAQFSPAPRSRTGPLTTCTTRARIDDCQRPKMKKAAEARPGRLLTLRHVVSACESHLPPRKGQ